MVTSILVGVDDSAGARTALAWAAGVVGRERERGDEPLAVAATAWSPPFGEAGLFTGLVDGEELEEDAGAAVDEALAELDHPEWFETAVGRGSAAEVLLGEAERIDADLVIVGSRGRNPLAKVLLGSVSRSVAAQADRPVAIVPATAAWAEGPTVVGYDGSPGADAALRWAVDNCRGQIKVVSAWFLPSDAVYDLQAIDVVAFEREVRERLEAAIASVEAEMDAEGGGDDRPGLEAIVQRDDPRLALLDSSLGAVRIVMGARAQRGVKGLLLGSTVDYIASHSTVTVVVIPPAHEAPESVAGDGGRG